jgi:TPR repeat protein
MNKLFLLLVSVLCASGFSKDYTRTEIKELSIAAEKGEAAAQYEYGLAHYHVAAGGGGYIIRLGLNGGPANPVEAAKWFLKAAEQGHAEACLSIAQMYDEGVGVICSGIDAEKWMKQYAAKTTSADGRIEHIMAVFYAKDRPDLPKNDKESVSWNLKAAILSAGSGRNDARWIEASRIALATYYSDPKASDFNLTKAYAWWSVAAASGDTYASKKRTESEKRLSPAEIKEGRSLAGQLMQQIESKKKAAR